MSRASPICHVIVDASELIADVLGVVRPLRLAVGVDVDTDPCRRAISEDGKTPLLVITSHHPGLAVAIALADRSAARRAPILLACVDRRSSPSAVIPQLGLPQFGDVEAALAALLIVHATSSIDGIVSSKGLALVDRARLPSASERGPKLARVDDGLLALLVDDKALPLGRVDDVERALTGLRAARRGVRPSLPRVQGADRSAALDVLIGPARSLSDPASKTALEAYDLPLPVEELCATASRAASESARIGYPVRVALASPELRPSEHPDLVVEGVDSAAAVRETFRELVALAERKDAHARVLGVTVSASTTARCLLRVGVERIAPTHLAATIGFGDAHGRATHDEVVIVLPATPEEIGHAIGRLRGAALLLTEAAAEARAIRTAVTDVVLRLSAFLEDFPEEVERVTIDPLAILIGGEAEIREACVQVSDSFSRSL